MTDPADKPDHEAGAAGEGAEHPLSVLLFSWMRTPLFARLLLAVLTAVCLLLVALELVIERHPNTAVESVPGFYGIYGFIAFALAVLSGWPLGKLLRRREDYYATDRPAGEKEEDGDDR